MKWNENSNSNGQEQVTSPAGWFVCFFCKQDFINTSVSTARLLSLIEQSGLNQLLFSEKALCLSVTSLSRSAMKQTDMSAILGTGGRSPLILQTPGLLGNMSMVRWFEHIFLFRSCETYSKLPFFSVSIFAPRTNCRWDKLAVTTASVAACY